MSIVSPHQIKMARAALSWSIQKLADQSKVSPRTLNRIETDAGFQVATKANLTIIKQTLEDAGIEFIGSVEEGPGVRLWSQG
ncbi:helix-turn-helix domain-containing protein [Planktomarina temperata]|nr:helix-turn-helix domain-containing protein [Planktomarina temperata]MDB2369873.1 helix-turn-helix domain-containing protein [Planktomarina temperata]MDB2459764.1 helix-turn-helix domain-containing protein [Planktomarina temperata]